LEQVRVIPELIMDGVKLKANGVPWPVSRLELVIAGSMIAGSLPARDSVANSQGYQLLVRLAFGARFLQA
jgi:hypothetical protein